MTSERPTSKRRTWQRQRAHTRMPPASRALERVEQQLLGAVEVLIGKALMVRIPAEFQTEVKP